MDKQLIWLHAILKSYLSSSKAGGYTSQAMSLASATHRTRTSMRRSARLASLRLMQSPIGHTHGDHSTWE